jgi:hypothetical protein
MPQRYLQAASEKLSELDGHVLDVLSIRKPLDEEEALGWAKIVSKLSPILGNLLEFEIVRLLNQLELPAGCSGNDKIRAFPTRL